MQNSELEEFRLALRMVGFEPNVAAVEMFMKTYDAFLTKRGEFSVRDAAKIRTELKEKYGSKLMSVSFDI